MYFQVLFLGASESGKSTLIRQIRMLHDHSFTEKELTFFRERIQHSTVAYLVRLALAVKGTMVISLEWDQMLAQLVEIIMGSKYILKWKRFNLHCSIN